MLDKDLKTKKDDSGELLAGFAVVVLVVTFLWVWLGWAFGLGMNIAGACG